MHGRGRRAAADLVDERGRVGLAPAPGDVLVGADQRELGGVERFHGYALRTNDLQVNRPPLHTEV